MKTTTIIAAALAYCTAALALCTATQAIVIQEIYADPLGSETGGEAVLLYNDADFPVDISGSVLSTPSNAQDATIPAGTTLAPRGLYLIADTGWSSLKDNTSWSDASLEDSITLRNSGGTLSLLDASGSTVDSIAYPEAEEGIASWRQGHVLVATEPLFSPPLDALTVLTAGGNASATMRISILDGNATVSRVTPVPGTAKHLLVSITSGSDPCVTFRNTTLPVEPLGNDRYAATLLIDSGTPPGTYSVTATADGTASVPLTVLPSMSLESDVTTLSLGTVINRTLSVEGDASFGTAKPTIRNAGNVPIEVRLSRTTLLRNGTRTGAIVTARADKDTITVTSTSTLLTTLQPGASAPLSITLTLPDGSKTGDYRTSFAFQLNEHK